MNPPRVLVLGDVVVDVIAQMHDNLALGSDTSATVRIHGGGAGGNVAAWLATAGARPILVARVGDDDPGHSQAAELRAAGVTPELTFDAPTPTGRIVVLVHPDGERTMLPDRGANLHLAPADIPQRALDAVDHVHVSGYLLLHPGPRPAAQHALAAARERGLPVSVDPSSAQPLAAFGAERFLRLLGRDALLSPNLDELEVLTGTRDPSAGGRALASACGEAVVTLGAEGAMWTDGKDQARVPAVPTEVVDTAGAGDAFLAGFLSRRIAGSNPTDALAAGAELAARAVGEPGARPPQAVRREARTAAPGGARE